MAGNLADMIMYGKFQDDIFRGYDFKVGRISHFFIDFCMGLTTVQRYCAACDTRPTIVGEEYYVSGRLSAVFPSVR